jgi:hypothetical protein
VIVASIKLFNKCVVERSLEQFFTSNVPDDTQRLLRSKNYDRKSGGISIKFYLYAFLGIDCLLFIQGHKKEAEKELEQL